MNQESEQDQVFATASSINELLAQVLPDQALSTKTARIGAEVLKAQDSKNFELRNFTLEHLLNVYVGQALTKRLPQYHALHAQLVSEGAVSQDRSRTFLRDEYSIYAVPTQEYAERNKVVTKALVLQTLEGNYLVVLNEKFGQWTVHFRQFWPELSDALASSGYLVHLEEHRSATNLTLMDVAKLSSAMSKFSDEFPGVIHPSRPNLRSFLAGKLIVGGEGESSGLSYGDARDTGYIASLRNCNDQVAHDVCESSLPALHLVAKLLRQAATPLND